MLTSIFKVGDLEQLVMALVAYWLGALPKVAGSNPGGSMTNYFHKHVHWLLILNWHRHCVSLLERLIPLCLYIFSEGEGLF